MANAEQNRKISAPRLWQIACEPCRQVSRITHLVLARFANACEDSFSLQAGLKSREELKTELEDRERTTKEGKKDSAASTSTPLALGGGGATLQLGSGEAEKDADDIDAANVAVSRVRRKASTLTYTTCK